MNVNDIVRKYTLKYSVEGAEQSAATVAKVGQAHDQTAKQVDANSAATTKYEAALARQQRQFDLQMRQQAQFTQALQQINAQQQQATAANDNVARSMDRMATSGYTFTGILARIGLTVAATALGVGALYTAFKILYEVVTFLPNQLSQAWELGAKKLEEFRAVAEKAAAVDLSTTYFQRLTKGAEAAKVPVDTLTQALITLQKQSADQLGGSALQNRLDASVKAGNFQNNSGVGQFAAANSLQEKFQAISTLIHNAMQDGQRLAALDIANTAFGPQITDSLRKDSEYLDKINTAAAKVAETELVSPADVGRALDLQRRYEAAVAILEQRWTPIQDLQIAAGIRMHAVWVDIVESIAGAVTELTKLANKTLETDWNDLARVFGFLQKGANVAGQFITDLTTTAESRKAAEQRYGISSNPADVAATGAINDQAKAVDGLSASMKNYYLQQQMVTQASGVANKVRGDTSHAIDTETKSLTDTNDAYDRARDAAQKHYAATNADSAAISLGIGAQAEFRTKAALTTAALIAQRDMTPALRAEIDAYGKAARTAAEANERLKIAAQIKFDRATIGLSAEDAQIASQLKGLYPDVTTALNSTEAAQMRLNNQMRLGHEIVSGFGNDLVSGLLRGENAMKSLEGAATNLIAKLASKNLTNFLNGGSIFGNQSLNSAQGAVGMASAGLAGYQSGSPLAGALGGAMAGATFGPAGMAVGGLIGLVSGIFGADDKSRQQLQQAQEAWKPMAPSFSAFTTAKSETRKPPVSNDNEEKKGERDDRDQHRNAA